VRALCASLPALTSCGGSILGLGGEVVQVPDVDSWGKLRMKEVTVCSPACSADTRLVLFTLSLPQVPPHHVWLQGDNPRNSNDSRLYGAVPEALIHGRVFFRIWPLTDFGPVRPDASLATVISSPSSEQ